MSIRRLSALAAPLLLVCCKPPPPAPPPVVAATPVDAGVVVVAPKKSLEELQADSIKAWLAGFNAHDKTRLAALYTPNAVSGIPFINGWLESKANSAEGSGFIGWTFRVLPDVQAAPTRVFRTGNIAVVEWTMRGTNRGEMDGEPATNKPVGLRGASVLWFNDDGLIEKEHIYYDGVTLRQQLGKIPGKSRPPPPESVVPSTWIVAMSTPEEQKVLTDKARAHWPTLWPKKEGKAYEDGLTDDAVHEDLASVADVQGKSANGKELTALLKTFPDLGIYVDNVWAAGTFALVEFTWSGTMKGPLGALKPTGKPVTVHAFEVDELRGDKLARRTTYSNGLELLAAMGAYTPPKASAPPPAAPATPATAPATPPASALPNAGVTISAPSDAGVRD